MCSCHNADWPLGAAKRTEKDFSQKCSFDFKNKILSDLIKKKKLCGFTLVFPKCKSG